LSNYNIRNKSNYFGNLNNENSNSFNLNQAGGVLVFNDYNPKNDWKKIALAINYENINNFDNSLFSSGFNPTNSIDNYFLSYANANPNIGQLGIPLKVLQNSFYENLNYEDQQAFLGYNGYIINPVDASNPNNIIYDTNVPNGGNYYQENYLESTGYNGKLNFNFAAQYKDQLYIGVNLNSHFTDYRHSTSFYESNNNSSDTGVRSLRFNNDLHTYGDGFSFQLGTIAKITKEFRLGLSYDSPTWFRLNDELRQTLSSKYFKDNNSTNPEITNTTVDSDFVIIYDPYNLRTPGKWTGSLAYIFGKSGLISVDYALKDYSNTKFTSSTVLKNNNSDLSNLLTTAGELRVGAEYRIKQWSLRGGYRNEQSPYKNGKTIGDLTSMSAGIGYNFGSTKLDLSYSLSNRESQNGFFRESQNSFFSQGFTDSASVKTKNSNVSVTLLFEL
jgi:long-subunit fatty acid transport protein